MQHRMHAGSSRSRCACAGARLRPGSPRAPTPIKDNIQFELTSLHKTQVALFSLERGRSRAIMDRPSPDPPL
ncbi:hypothetical protein EVAR_67133_1 [Eumeta japonica]|uniref:Uncharacterized protein n=1 Tax=Eumeta variegata TaxID=151549 RepID=A0A4C1ZSS9_EUMVA|nr:hypothetical protein EVAR_67133_1 [Eumeta japonica]